MSHVCGPLCTGTRRDAADRAALLRSRAGPGAAAAEAEAPEEERSGLHSDVEVQIENMLSGGCGGGLGAGWMRGAAWVRGRAGRARAEVGDGGLGWGNGYHRSRRRHRAHVHAQHAFALSLSLCSPAAGQSHASLVSMEGDVERALAGGLGDPEYWEAVLKRLQVCHTEA